MSISLPSEPKLSVVANPHHAGRSLPSPARRSFVRPLADKVILEFSLADDVRSGMAGAVGLLRREGAVERVEWWAPSTHGGSLELQAAEGLGRGRRVTIPLGPAGNLVVAGDTWDTSVMVALNRLAPVLRRRWSEEQLATRAARIARQNEALEDFAALVAHELKGPLNAALREGDAPAGVRQALELVDSLLEAARSECAEGATAPVAACLEEALRDLGPLAVEIVAQPDGVFPMPPAVLRLVLRNLVANAVAAGARHVGVSVTGSPVPRTLTVDDDGVGVGSARAGEYAVGSSLGLSLCRRLVARFGAALELAPRACCGTRVTLRLEESG
jgi:signal transduction histidine kinase